MTRKSKKLQQEKKLAAEKLVELNKLAEEAQKEEQQLLETTRTKIDEICKNAGVFCGALLTPEHLGGIVTLATSSKEIVQLPYALYFLEETQTP